ncbi:acyltransferase family protein [Mycobacterium paraseoulense]|uniref:acyltransferase family protein n=1 Tax=Mycobacterium paraseoulense TaxID=590652 RepID=UPI0009F69B21|nr:acyltransferase [Mycobacterium paraseoulense]
MEPGAETLSDGAAASGQRPRRPGFRQDIEGLRAVAVLAVVLFHSNMPGLGGGFVGVDVFFVISGFLITGLLWREASSGGTIRLGRFYGARARRLLPASATVGVVTAIASAVLLNPLQARTVIGDGIASALYVGNYRFAVQGVDYQIAYRPPSPFQHYWSLGVEEQFYLLWPAIIIGTAWLIRRTRRHAEVRAVPTSAPYLLVLALVGAASFAVSLVATHVAPSVAFFSLPTRAWELAVGGLVALSANQWRRLPVSAAAIAGWAGLVLILLSCNTIGATTPYPGTAALLPVLGTALVIGAGCAGPAWGCGRLLALAPMRAVGRVSYSWYLWHWPVLLLAPPLLGRSGLGPVDGLAALAVSLGLAVLTLRLIENPFRYAASVRRSATRSLALGGATTALAVCVGVALLVLVPDPVGRGPAAPTLTVAVGPLPTGRNAELYDAAVQHAFAQVQSAVAASAELKALPSNLDPSLADAVKAGTNSKSCVLNLLEIDQPECASGDTASTTTVALIGDSTAGMWGSALQQVAVQRHWRLETLSKASCPMLDLPFTNALLQRKYTECDQWRGRTLGRLQSEHPRLVVLSMLRHDLHTGFPPYGRAWNDSLTRLLRELRGTGANVLVLGPIPDLHSDVPECLSVHLDDATACSSPRTTAVDEPGMAAESAATKAAGGQYADVTELFCTADRCPAFVGNTLVYHNEFHLTSRYAQLLAPVIDALADRAVVLG